MNEEIELIKKQGWILSASGLKSFEQNGNAKKNITKILLDRDLREIGAGIADLHKGKFENIEQELVVLQILKIRNISAPKSNESSKTAPKLLKLTLTDGQNTYSAIEMESTALSVDTRPGTKISLKIKQLKYVNGQLLLTPKNMEILGGYVESLVSKWEISKSLATTMKGNRTGGAPPFIPFGQKIQQNLPNDRGFKSLQQSKQKEVEENSEFNAQRQDAIAEASKAATRKTFGGGNKILVDSNVQKIMDKGYSEEQATVALKYAKNNVEKALGNLKRRDERQQRSSSHDFEPHHHRENPREYNSKRGSGGKGANNHSDMPTAKPSTGVSLFDFLENKIPETTSSSNTAKQSYAQNSTSSSSHYNNNHSNNERFENNISSSFRKHDKENTNKSHQQWSHQYSSSNDQSKSSQNYQKNSYNSRNDYRNQNNDSKEHYNRDYSRKYEKDSRDYQQRDGQRESKYQSHQSNNYSSKPNNSSSSAQYSSKPSSHVANHKPSVTSSSSNAVNNGAPQNSYNNHSAGSKGKYGQKPDYNGQQSSHNNSGGKMTSKDYNSYSSGANNNNGGSYNSKYDKPRSTHASHNNSSNDMYHQKPQRNNIAESMEKMSLNKNNHHSYKSYEPTYESKSNNSSYPPLVPAANESKPSFSKQQQSNYPIVGFQNKEANEQAKNALKTKNIPGNVSHTQKNWQPPNQKQQPVSQQVPMIPQNAPMNGPPPPFSTNLPAQQQPQAMHSIPPQQPPYVQHQVMMSQAVLTTSNPQVFHTASITYPGQIIMQSVQPPAIQQVPQPLKVGDLCLAKYWEDGKFYNAKITGNSESTFVVLFTEYGNAEEVRKNDCVPVISVQTVPTCPTPPQQMNNFVPPAQMGSYRSISQQKMQAQQHGYQQGMSSYKPTGKNPRRN